MDDSKFRRDYAKSLAQALQEKKEPNKETLIKETYIALCFDDPRVQEGDEACRLLAHALTRNESPYRISDPLVEGIQQVTERSHVVNTTSLNEKDENEEEIVWHTGGVATAAGYALLAFTCYVKIPLHCCQASGIDVVKKMLGSYRGPKRRQTQEDFESERLALAKSQEEDARIKALSQGLSDMAAVQDAEDESTTNEQEQSTEYEEVWAAESDPSDFEYESGQDAQQALQELDQWPETAFDPEALSKPPESTDWADLKQAITNLLSQLVSSKLAPLSKQQWNSLRVSDLLSQLTLTLLIQPENACTDLLDEELQQLGIQPLFVLRDRVASHSHVLGEYLTLVQTLVAVDAADPTRCNKSLAPATIVGLGALSSLCHATEDNKEAPQKIRLCVLETCEDLSHIMEKSRRESDSLSTVIHLMWTLLPLLDRLTNVTSKGTVWESSCCSLSNADSQLLLQTGVFRELILLYTCTKDENASSEAVRAQLLQCIECMCMQSTSLLGKYAWRVPDLSKIVQSSTFAQDHVVDGLVWNLLGTTLAGGPVRLKLKNVPVVTAQECLVQVVAGMERLCGNVENAMQAIQQLRKGSTPEDSAWKEPIQELSRFSNYFISCPSFATLWKTTVTSDDNTAQQVKSAIDSLRNALSQLARIPESTKRKAEKSAENDKAVNPLERPVATHGENEEAAVRKAIKILLASGKDSGVSSKTD